MIAWLVAASLLALCLAQPLHPGPAPGSPDVSHLTAASTASGTASPPHEGVHPAGICSFCRALAQTRVALRSPLPGAAGAPDAAGIPLPVGALDEPRPAPPPASTEPRAPPRAPARDTA